MSDSPLGQVLGKIPSGLFILTAKHDSQETGMLASWVVQAGFEPPMVSIAIRQDRYLAGWLQDGCPIVLNIVGTDQKKLLGHFGRGFDIGQPAFTDLAIERCSRGVPILADSVGHLECTPREHLDSGDHRIFLAEVIGGRPGPQKEPYVHIRSNGFRY